MVLVTTQRLEIPVSRKLIRATRAQVTVAIAYRMMEDDQINEAESCNPQKPDPEPDYPVYVAKYDYDCRSDVDLGFKKRDLLYVISTDGDWWFAQHKDTGQKGFIPSNYVAENLILEAEE